MCIDLPRIYLRYQPGITANEDDSVRVVTLPSGVTIVKCSGERIDLDQDEWEHLISIASAIREAGVSI